MILDSGICSIFRPADVAEPGAMPSLQLTLIGQSWYGELNYESSPTRPTKGRNEQRTDQRIRILQNKAIRQNDVAVLMDVTSESAIPAGAPRYAITRCFHGLDDDGPTLITDLSLEVTRP